MNRIAALFVLVLTGAAAHAQEVTEGTGAVLRGLDKVSGITSDIPVTAGGTAEYGTLVLSVSQCRYPTDDPSSNAFAFVRISEAEDGIERFAGWMIASSPALNALDHARYDVWLLRCQIEETSEEPSDDNG